MKSGLFISQKHAIVLLRITIAVLFMAHAAVRIANGSIPQFGKFLESRGFPAGEAWVWAITVVELVAGSAMVLGWRLKCAAAALFAIAAGGIWIIHRHLGWFVGEHGTGGVEYSLALMAALIVIAAADADQPGRRAAM
jgi:putative oxidoreductase